MATIHALEKWYRELYVDPVSSPDLSVGPVEGEEVMLGKKFAYLSKSEKVVYQSELGWIPPSFPVNISFCHTSWRHRECQQFIWWRTCACIVDG